MEAGPVAGGEAVVQKPVVWMAGVEAREGRGVREGWIPVCVLRVSVAAGAPADHQCSSCGELVRERQKEIGQGQYDYALRALSQVVSQFVWKKKPCRPVEEVHGIFRAYGMKRALQRIIARSAKGRCAICGRTGLLVCHHIRGRNVPDWNRKHNEAWICPNCHADIHASPPKVAIEGWVMTTDGYRLAWRRAGEAQDCMEGAEPPLYSPGAA